jgi:hypothetical protein
MGIEEFNNSEPKKPGPSGDTIDLSKYHTEIIEGCLLGDGTVSSPNSGNPHFIMANKEVELLEHMMDVLPDGMFSNRSIQDRYIRSRRFKNLCEFRDQWYDDGHKVLPSDFSITDTKLMYWYLGDGGLERDAPVIRCNWAEGHVDKLKDEMSKLISENGIINSNTDVRVYRGNSGIRLYVPKNLRSAFFKTIGPSPVDCYRRRWP